MSDLPDMPPEDPPIRDTGVLYTFINPTTGEVTTNLTDTEVFELEEKWRADYDARLQAKIEADAAAYVPPDDDEDYGSW